MTRRLRQIDSTGAQPTPAIPVTTQAVAGVPVSTGAEPFDDQPVTTRVSHLDDPVVVHSPLPGPVTVTVGWLTDTAPTDTAPTVEAKVIEPAERDSPESARAQAQTSRHRGRTRDR